MKHLSDFYTLPTRGHMNLPFNASLSFLYLCETSYEYSPVYELMHTYAYFDANLLFCIHKILVYTLSPVSLPSITKWASVFYGHMFSS